MRELNLKKCLNCGAIIESLEDCKCKTCNIQCCNENMQTLNINQNDVMAYEIARDTIIVKIDDSLKENKSINWIAMFSDNVVGKKFLNKNEEKKVAFPYIPNSKIYCYSDEFGLFCKDIK